MVGRLDLGDCARHRLVDIADVLRDHARLQGGLFELVQDIFGAELCVRAVVPLDDQGREAFLRGSHVIGDHGDGVVEPHDLPYTLDRLGRRIVNALNAAAERRRLRQCRELHARRTGVDAEDGRSIDLRQQVEPLRRCADQLEILRLLERHFLGHGNTGCIGDKIAIVQTPAGRGVQHLTALRAAGRRIDLPALGRGRD